MYVKKPADLFIEHAELQFVSNFSGMRGFRKPQPGEPISRDICIKIETLERAEELNSLGWPVEIYYRGPKMDNRDEQIAYAKKIKELIKKNCTNYEEKKAFLIEKGEFNTECVSFYIKANISYKYADKAPIIYLIMPMQKTIKQLTEMNVGQLDGARIINLNVILNPSWNPNTQKYTVFVKSAEVTIEENPIDININQNYEGYTMIGLPDEE